MKKDCTTCKYGYEDEQLGIPMCHHPKRFSDDCVDFNMHEEKETETEHRGSSEIPNDLESYAQKVEDYYDVGEERGYLCTHRGDIKNAVLAGAKWQAEQDLAEMAQSKSPLSVAYANRYFENGKQAMKEQMLKEAVDGVVGRNFTGVQEISFTIYPDKFKDGQKVKIIIVKED